MINRLSAPKMLQLKGKLAKRRNFKKQTPEQLAARAKSRGAWCKVQTAQEKLISPQTMSQTEVDGFGTINPHRLRGKLDLHSRNAGLMFVQTTSKGSGSRNFWIAQHADRSMEGPGSLPECIKLKTHKITITWILDEVKIGPCPVNSTSEWNVTT